MNQLHFTKPGAPIDEHVITVDNPLNGFISPTPNELHQEKIVSYAQNSAGTIVAGILGRFDAERFFIQGLWVNNTERNRGVGTRLLGLIENYVQGKNIKTICLETNHLKLIEFYVKNKYKIVASKKDNNTDHKHFVLKKTLVKIVEADKEEPYTLFT